MDEELRIKKKLIDLLNEKESIKVFELLSNEFYIEHQRIETKLKENDNNANKLNDNDRISRKEIDKEEEEIEQLLNILKNKDIVSITPTFEKRVKKTFKFKNFKKGFYIKLILNELLKNDAMEELNHKNISIGEISYNDLEVFYKQCKMLLRENIIIGANKDPFKNKGKDWTGLVRPEIVISETKSDIILNEDEFNVMAKIEEIMSENKNNQPKISVTGNNNNIANGNNNNQTITINESELVNSILESVSKVKNKINEEKYNEIINVLEEIKRSPKNKAELWERFIGLTADIGSVGNMVLKAIVPFLQ